jgi:DNA polymerase III epsilon subunit-like protein
MNKIMMDTETANTIAFDNKLDMSNVLPYDIGMAPVDDDGKVLETISLVIEEIFYGMPDLMKSAYYAEKIPQYEREIAEGKRKVVNVYQAHKILRTLLKKYKTNIVVSHNARFDSIALKNLSRYLTKSKYREFLPCGTEYYDTLKMARDTICKEQDYIEFCVTNGYMTKHKTPRARATAEILYRYIKRDLEFIEAHTGLEDCLIEAEIMTYIYKNYKEFRKALYEKRA